MMTVAIDNMGKAIADGYFCDINFDKNVYYFMSANVGAFRFLVPDNLVQVA
jgi:hypothetical protein